MYIYICIYIYIYILKKYAYLLIYTVLYIRCATSRGEAGVRALESLPCPIWKIEKIYFDFGKKDPVCVHLWVEFSFKMQFSEYLGEKIP